MISNRRSGVFSDHKKLPESAATREYPARVYPPPHAKEMIATAVTTAARAVGTRTAPTIVGAVRSFWADVPMAPKVRADRSSRSILSAATGGASLSRVVCRHHFPSHR